MKKKDILRCKQKKRKDKSDEHVYGSQGGVVELHLLKDFKIGDKKLGDILLEKDKEIETLNKRVDNSKEIIKALNEHIQNIERVLKKHGLK